MSLATSNVYSGMLAGTGAAANVSLGFVPDRVDLIDLTAGTVVYTAFPSSKGIAFTAGGGGTNNQTINAGATIVGATSGATAVVKQVLVTSGSFTGGNATGFMVLDAATITGTFGTENVYIKGGLNASNSTNQADAAVTAPVVEGVKVSGAAGPVSDTSITAYLGSTSASQGFTISSGANTSGHLFSYTATRA